MRHTERRGGPCGHPRRASPTCPDSPSRRATSRCPTACACTTSTRVPAGRDRPPAARPAHVVLPLPHRRGPPGRARPARRRPGPDRLRPFRQAAGTARRTRCRPTSTGCRSSSTPSASPTSPSSCRTGAARSASGLLRRTPGLRAPDRRRQHRAAHCRCRAGGPPGVGLSRQPGRHRHRGAAAARLPAPDPGAHAVPAEPLRAGCHRVGRARRASWPPTTRRSPTSPSARGRASSRC